MTAVASGGYTHTAYSELTVVTDDGIALHVEIDDGARAANAGRSRKAPARPTVVFSHGYTLSLRSWVLQRRALVAAGYRVVLWDQRSHGRSAVSPIEDCTIERIGADLEAVIEATCPEGPLVLIGHSMGGMTMMSLAGRAPELIRNRVLAAAFVATSAGGRGMTSLGFGPVLGRAIGRVGPGVLTRLGRHQAWLDRFRRMGRDVEEVVVGRYSFDSQVSEDLVRFVSDMIFGTPLEVMAAFMPHIDRLDQIDHLDAFQGIETLVMNGEGDMLTPPSHSEDIVRRIPGAEHVVVERAGHLIMLEHPELVTQQLLMLVDRAERAHAAGIAMNRKPRVRRMIADLSPRRRPPQDPSTRATSVS